jgi:site-specific DNA recombinase
VSRSPLGYDVRDRLPVINQKEAETVRLIFQLYSRLRSVRLVRDELDLRSILSKTRTSRAGVRSGGVRFGRGALYQMLANPIYIGEIRHKRTTHPGQHEAIIELTTWQQVQKFLAQSAGRARGSTGEKTKGFLAGKLLDENGEPLYSCGAKKGGRRYRYFVSRKLIRGSSRKDGLGWRLPAEETPRAVLLAVRQMLSDRPGLARLLKDRGLGAAALRNAPETIVQKAQLFDEIDPRDIVDRVELKPNGIQLTLNLRCLTPCELLTVREVNPRITRLVPMQLKRRGVETRLIILGEESAPARNDPALLRALARGYKWFAELASGASESTRQIARREGVSDSYVRHVVPLGLLAPPIVESICVGNQSPTLTAERLKVYRGS